MFVLPNDTEMPTNLGLKSRVVTKFVLAKKWYTLVPLRFFISRKKEYLSTPVVSLQN